MQSTIPKLEMKFSILSQPIHHLSRWGTIFAQPYGCEIDTEIRDFFRKEDHQYAKQIDRRWAPLTFFNPHPDARAPSGVFMSFGRFIATPLSSPSCSSPARAVSQCSRPPSCVQPAPPFFLPPLHHIPVSYPVPMICQPGQGIAYYYTSQAAIPYQEPIQAHFPVFLGSAADSRPEESE